MSSSHVEEMTERRDPLCADIPEWPQEFRENLVDDNGPSYVVQTHFPEKQRMADAHVVVSDPLQQDIRFYTTCSNLDLSQKSFGQCTIHFTLEKLYTNQRATARTDVESDEFGIARGTKQGGPLSSLLFNSVLQSSAEKDIETWKEKGLTIKLSGEKRDCISNLRFADDVLMMAASLKQLKKLTTPTTNTTTTISTHKKKDKAAAAQKKEGISLSDIL